jgi:hypothetical protein
MDTTEDIAFEATDGYPLRAKRYAPPGRRIGHLIVAGATAVPQGFYARFAATAAARCLLPVAQMVQPAAVFLRGPRAARPRCALRGGAHTDPRRQRRRR